MADYLYFPDGTAEAVPELDNRENDHRMRTWRAISVYWVWQRDANSKPCWVMRTRKLSSNVAINDDNDIPTSVKMLHLLADGVNQ